MNNITLKIKKVKLEAILLNKNKRNNFHLELHGRLHHNTINNNNRFNSKIHILDHKNMEVIHNNNNQHCKNLIH